MMACSGEYTFAVYILSSVLKRSSSVSSLAFTLSLYVWLKPYEGTPRM